MPQVSGKELGDHVGKIYSEIADFEYKCSEFYNPKSEKTLMWNDATLNIPWPSKDPELSEKDAKGLSLLEYSS